MKHDILNCPHCGGQGKVVVMKYEPDPESGPGIGFSSYDVHVSCNGCGAKGPVVEYIFKRDEKKNTIKAIKLWNRRNDANHEPIAQWEDGELEPQEEPATEKQIKFAEKMADRLGLELPERKSKSEYRLFISKHRHDWDMLFKRRDDAIFGDFPVYCADDDDCPFYG